MLESSMSVQEISLQSGDYKAALDIRERVLRKPLGMTFTDQDLAEDQNDIHFVIKDAGVVAGTVVMKPMSDGNWRLRQLAVEPKYQGQNIGGFLTRHCEGYARSKGAKKIVLHSRLNVVKFYQAMNYITIGEEFYEVGIPHFKMEKTL
jgi:predicted GNAT family N-acyltransferase